MAAGHDGVDHVSLVPVQGHYPVNLNHGPFISAQNHYRLNLYQVPCVDMQDHYQVEQGQPDPRQEHYLGEPV